MFTGIVLERGRVLEPPRDSGRGGRRLVIGHSGEMSRRLRVSDSLAVSGVCLTLTGGSAPGRSLVELSPETLARTNLGDLTQGDEVNLEPALRVGDALGGHWVQGHVDTVVEVVERRDLGEHRELAFSLPGGLSPYVVEKGSVTLDGVSLTVSARHADRFEVALIPHTLEVTTLSLLVPGRRVNFEVDILAKYIHQALAARGLVDAVEEGSAIAGEPADG